MARVRLKGPVEEIRGTFYDVVFKKSPSGKTIISKKPDMSGVEWSEAQWDQRKRFSLANEYVQAVKAEPKVWAAYQKRAKKQKKRARDLAFSDYCNGKNLLLKKQAA